MYKITLADGTELKNLEMNGNNYIAEGVLEDSVFERNLTTVTITDGETTEAYTDMRLMSNRVEDGRSWFVLGEKTAQQKAKERMEAQIAANADRQEFLEDCIAEMASQVYSV